MILENCEVLFQRKISNDQYILKLKAPGIAMQAEPGQFVQLKQGNGLDPLLRRPFSIHTVSRSEGAVFIHYMTVGRGTKQMNGLSAGDTVSLLGPLGRPFDTDIADKEIILVGGGIGQAPLRFLAEKLAEKNNRIYTILGAREKSGLENRICFEEYCRTVSLSTEDGSLGIQGFATLWLEKMIPELKPARVYSCGPMVMMKAVKTIAERNGVPCQLSLEANMACGVGVCLGCTVRGTEENYYPKVCKDGPVFWSGEVTLDEWS